MGEAEHRGPVVGPIRAPGDPRDPRADSLLRQPPGGAAAGWSLLGVPYDGGIPSRPGARMGPAALRRALAAFTTFDGRGTLPRLDDLGDLDLPSMNGAAAHERIEQAASSLFAARTRCVFVGGDHGCTGSILRGLAASSPSSRLAVIGLDAHLDVREYDDAASLSSGTPFRRALEAGVRAGDLALIGLRPFANSEYYLRWATEKGIRMFTVDDVIGRGAERIAREALDRLAGVDGIYLSVDLDAADAAFAPGVSAPGIGGLSSHDMIALVRTIAADDRVVAADFMELSPPYDEDDRTARLAARLLLELLSARAEATGTVGSEST